MSGRGAGDCWRTYQNIIKEAEQEHLSNIIENRKTDNAHVLFKTINVVLKPPQHTSHHMNCVRIFYTIVIYKIVTARIS